MRVHFSKAYTLVEVLVATAMLMVVTLGIVGGITQLFRIQRVGSQKVTDQEIVSMIAEGVKADSSVYQKNLSGVDLSQVDPSKLPLGYTEGLDLMPRTKCPTNGCQIYAGYVIQPVSNMPGLFQGTVRIYTPSVNGSSVSDNVYKFLTTAK